MSKSPAWIGVDFDGTLSEYHGWQGIEHYGEPIPGVVNLVKKWLSEGKSVRIVTARLTGDYDQRTVVSAIHHFCDKAGLPRLEVTASKDFNMVFLMDDRALQVETNTGRILGDYSKLPLHEILKG